MLAKLRKLSLVKNIINYKFQNNNYILYSLYVGFICCVIVKMYEKLTKIVSEHTQKCTQKCCFSFIFVKSLRYDVVCYYIVVCLFKIMF